MKYKITEMPKVALGTWMVKDAQVIDAIIPAALQNGYKHIDTAQLYQNEHLIGETLKKINIDREEYWITTKVAHPNLKYHTYESIKKSLERLQTNYIDTILLHTTVNEEVNVKAFKELIKAREEGLVRFIGVSNYSIDQMEQLKKATGEYPKYNQVIASVIQRLEELEEFCKQKNITLMGYSSIRPYYNPNEFYDNSSLTKEEKNIIDKIAKKHSTTPANVLNRFIYMMDYVILPKSEKVERVISNIECLKVMLDDEDIQILKNMNRFSLEELNRNTEKWLTSGFASEEVQKKGFLLD